MEEQTSHRPSTIGRHRAKVSLRGTKAQIKGVLTRQQHSYRGSRGATQFTRSRLTSAIIWIPVQSATGYEDETLRNTQTPTPLQLLTPHPAKRNLRI